MGDGFRVGCGDRLGSGLGAGLGEGLGDGAGVVVSTLMVSELLDSKPSALALALASEKRSDATEMTPLVVLLLEGVKLAV